MNNEKEFKMYHFLRLSSSFLVMSKCNIGITHGFFCINICRGPRKLFEHEAARPSVHIWGR